MDKEFMTLLGMSDETAVENILMQRYELDRSDAHSFANLAESGRDFMVRSGKVEWLDKRPKPVIEDWPEVTQTCPVPRGEKKCCKKN